MCRSRHSLIVQNRLSKVVKVGDTNHNERYLLMKSKMILRLMQIDRMTDPENTNVAFADMAQNDTFPLYLHALYESLCNVFFCIQVLVYLTCVLKKMRKGLAV